MFKTKLATEAAFSENQDRAAIIKHSDGLVLAIADGAGGIGGGGEAAELAIQLVKASAVANEFMNPFTYYNLLIEADDILFEHPIAGETTAIVVAVNDDLVCGASVGDSGAFLIQNQSEIDLTAKQRRKPLIGSGIATPTAFGPVPLKGTVLLATDGLIKYAAQPLIRKIVQSSSANEAAKALIECVRYPSGNLPDDVTVIITCHS